MKFWSLLFVLSLQFLMAQTSYSAELKKLYQDKEYAKTYRRAIEISKIGDRLSKSEAYLYKALVNIELYQMDRDASFKVLKDFNRFIKKDKKGNLTAAYSTEIQQIVQYLQTSIILLKQERRRVAANYMHKTLLYTLENTKITLEEKSKIADIKVIKSSSSNKKNESKNIEQMLEYAYTKIGIPYHYGGVSDRGYDCSGFTMKMFETLHLQIPRTAQEQAQIGQKIEWNRTIPGDLIFFEKHQNTINHVGIVTENSKGVIRMIHASTSRGIRIDVLEEGSYWHPRVRMARRIIN